jgi:hypothetical protein
MLVQKTFTSVLQNQIAELRANLDICLQSHLVLDKI